MSADEPTAGELMRGLNRIEKRIDDLVKGFVTVEVYRLLVDDVDDLKGDLAKERADREKAVGELHTSAEDRRKQRAQNLAGYGLAGVAVVFAIFGDIIAAALGLP